MEMMMEKERDERMEKKGTNTHTYKNM